MRTRTRDGQNRGILHGRQICGLVGGSDRRCVALVDMKEVYVGDDKPKSPDISQNCNYINRR